MSFGDVPSTQSARVLPPQPKKVVNAADRLLDLAYAEGWMLFRSEGQPKTNRWDRIFVKGWDGKWPHKEIHLQLSRGAIAGAIIFERYGRGRPLIWNHDKEQRASLFLKGVPCLCEPNDYLDSVGPSDSCQIHGVLS